MSLISRRTLVTGGPLAAATAGRVFARAAEPAVNFVAVGDWGRDGTQHQQDVANIMGGVAERAGSRFTISTGDNFYENGVQTAADPQWKSSWEDVYTHPGLAGPWHVALGNHDYRGVPQAQLDYAAAHPRWGMPARYYALPGAGVGSPLVDLFVLDTSPAVNSYRAKVHSLIAENVATQDVQAQLAWLDRALVASTAPWKLVVGHHTIYSGGSEHGNTPELIAQIVPILKRHGVQAYINGHEHDMQHVRVDGIDYITTGAGSEVRPTGSIPGTKFALSRSGFARFALTRAALALTFIDNTGKPVYDTSIVRATV